MSAEPGNFTLVAYVCVNCQKRHASSCRIFTGSDARRCVVGHINGSKACRLSQEGYAELSVPFNVRDRFVGGSGAAGGRAARRGSQDASEAPAGTQMNTY